MNCLVTGVAGFIGSHVARQLIDRGDSVVGVDNLNDYYDVRLKDYRLSKLLGDEFVLGPCPQESRYTALCGQHSNDGRFKFKPIDIENLSALDELFSNNQFDIVFNLAARAGVRYSMENPHIYLKTNAHGTLNVLESMRRHGVKKQVLASTSSLYAGCPMPFTEDQPVNTPLSPYAATKKAAEMLSYSYHKLYGIDTTVVRYFTVYGPAGRPDMSVFRFIRWVDRGSQLEVFGDGTQSRDFTFVSDIAHGTVLAGKPVGFEIVNLGGGRNPIALENLVQHIEKNLGKRAIIAKRPSHIADVKETWADISKAKRILGWTPSVSLEEGLIRTVKWHVENEEWLEEIEI